MKFGQNFSSTFNGWLDIIIALFNTTTSKYLISALIAL